MIQGGDFTAGDGTGGGNEPQTDRFDLQNEHKSQTNQFDWIYWVYKCYLRMHKNTQLDLKLFVVN